MRRARQRGAGGADYPERPVTLIVPYGAGGPLDTVARIITERWWPLIKAANGADDNVRVLPVAGDGAVGNVRDVLLLRGVDLGITTAQTLDSLKASGVHGPNLDQRIAYVAQLSVDMLHVVVRPEYSSLKDLQGKKVHFLQKGSSAAVFGRCNHARLATLPRRAAVARAPGRDRRRGQGPLALT